MKKIYIAGKIGTKNELELLEKVDSICKSLGLDTFLPHRDVGICKNINDVKRIFEGDILDGFESCDLVIAILDGLRVGAGTAWELGYAYAKKIPTIGLKTDGSIEESLEVLSAIIINSTPIVNSLEKMKIKIREMIGS